MKKCSLNEFVDEMKPWLDKDHIRRVEIDSQERFVVHFLDGTKHVYHVDDCNKEQVVKVLSDFEKKGIEIR